MIGVEAKYFITSQIAARFNGSGAIVSSPAADATMVTGEARVEGEASYPGTFVPGWEMMESRTTKQFYVDLGADYYFASNYSKVNPTGECKSTLPMVRWKLLMDSEVLMMMEK